MTGRDSGDRRPRRVGEGMYGRRLLLMLIASLALHAAGLLLAPKHAAPPARTYRERPKPVQVSVLKAAAKAIEAEPKPEPPKPPPPKVETPKPRPDTPKPPPKEAPPKAEAPPETPVTPVPPAPKKAAPLVLSNVALNGGVQVQTGSDSNVFGDPTKDATGFQKGRDAPRTGDGDGTGAGGPVAPKKVVVRAPEALNDVKGQYPAEHRDLNRVVRVELLLQINPAGEVVDAQVRRGDLPAFNDEARRTVKRLRFRPATRDGVPIPYQVPWTVVFLPEA